MKKRLILALCFLTTITVCLSSLYKEDLYYLTMKHLSAEDFNIKEYHSSSDLNRNGISDNLDLVFYARIIARNHPKYTDCYYTNGYPPSNEGVCTDMIWRCFKAININLKYLIDQDIQNNVSFYSRVNNHPDPNIDFRRVMNLHVFFARFATTLTNDLKKIEEFQPGDIIIFNDQHIAIVSDYRNEKGIPFIIHHAQNKHFKHFEEDALEYYNSYVKINGHYRYI